MRIDKVAPFYTEQDRIALAAYNSKLDRLAEDAHELNIQMQAAKEAGDNSLLQELLASSNTVWDNFQLADNERNELLRAIEQRYIEAFKGDMPLFWQM